MSERVLLHDWFFTFQLVEDTWTVVAWGRSHASSSSSRAPLRSHTVAERISLEQFAREDGTVVELVGSCDVARAKQAGVPAPVTTGFSKGVPPAWMLLLGLADSIYALATLPLALLPPGASQSPSPALSPKLPPADVESDDEALPQSLFDLGTGYQRPAGAPSTIKQLAAVLDLRTEPDLDDEELQPRRDRDAEYDEDAEEAEEGESIDKPRPDRANSASQGSPIALTKLEPHVARAPPPPDLDQLPSAAPDQTLDLSTTSTRLAKAPPLATPAPLSSAENLTASTKDSSLALTDRPAVDGAPAPPPDSALLQREAQPLPHLPSPHAATPPPEPEATITVTFPTPSAPAPQERSAATVRDAEQAFTEPSLEVGGEGAPAAPVAVEHEPTVELPEAGISTALEEQMPGPAESSRQEDPQRDARVSETMEQGAIGHEDDTDDREMVVDTTQQPMSFLETLEAFVATSPGASDNLELHSDLSPLPSSTSAAPHSPASLGAPFALASRPNADPSATLAPAHEPSLADGSADEPVVDDVATVAEGQAPVQAVENRAAVARPSTPLRDPEPRVVPESPGAHRESTPPPVAAFLGSDVSPQFEPTVTSFGALYQDSEVDSVDNFANDVVQFIADDAEGRGGQLRGRSATAETASEVAVEESLLRDRWTSGERHELDVVEEEPRSSQALPEQEEEEVVAESPRSSPALEPELTPKLELEDQSKELQPAPQSQPLQQPPEDRPLDDPPRLDQPSTLKTEQPPQQALDHQPLAPEIVQSEGITEEHPIEQRPTDEHFRDDQSRVKTSPPPRSPPPQQQLVAAEQPRLSDPLETDAASGQELSPAPKASVADFAALYRDDTAEPSAVDEGSPAPVLTSERMEDDVATPSYDRPLALNGTLDSSAEAPISRGQATTTDDDGPIRPAGLLSLLDAVDPTDTEDNAATVDYIPSRHSSPVPDDAPTLAPAAEIVEQPASTSAKKPRSLRKSTSFVVEVEVPTRRKGSQAPSSPAAKLASPKKAPVAPPRSPRKAASIVDSPRQASPVASTSSSRRAAVKKQPLESEAVAQAASPPPRHTTPPPPAAAPPRPRHPTASPRKPKLEPYVDIVVRRRFWPKPARSAPSAAKLAATAPNSQSVVAETEPESVPETNIEAAVESQPDIGSKVGLSPPALDKAVTPDIHAESQPVEDEVAVAQPVASKKSKGKRRARVEDSDDEDEPSEQHRPAEGESGDHQEQEEAITDPSLDRPIVDNRSPSLGPPLQVNSSPVKTSKKRNRPTKRSTRVADSEDETEKEASPVLEAPRDRSTSPEHPRARKRAKAVKNKSEGKAKAVVFDDEEEDGDSEAPALEREPTAEAENVDEDEDDEDDFTLGPSTPALKRTPSNPAPRSLAISRALTSTSRRASLPSNTSRSRSRPDTKSTTSSIRRKSSLALSGRPATPSSIASDSQTSANGRPQRARKSTDGWWKLDRALESLQSGKKRSATEEVEEQEQEPREKSKGRGSGRKKARMLVADSEEDKDEGHEQEEQGQEEVEVEVPVKRKTKSSGVRKSKSKAPSPPAPSLKPKLKAPRPHRTEPTNLASTKGSKPSKSLPRWADGASWEGLGEVGIAREAKEDGWSFSD